MDGAHDGIGDRAMPRWKWIATALIVGLLVSCLRFGRGLPMILQDGAFLALISLPFFLIVTSWMGFFRARNSTRQSGLRLWISLCGCVALSLTVAIPFLVLFSSMFLRLGFDWLRLLPWCIAFCAATLLAGIFGAKSTRFSLIFGGIALGAIVLLIPVGIL